MANTFYDPGDRRARVQELFARIAPRYDLINDLQSLGLHRWWKRRLLHLALPRPGLCALDLCCGTGDLAFALARHGVGVVGLDFSEPMLQVADRKGGAPHLRTTPSSRLHTPRFIRADALQLPFP